MCTSGTSAEIFVISDTHIGGEYSPHAGARGFRINTHSDVLAQFIDEVGERASSKAVKTELVINGDFVDFLAEQVPPHQRWMSFIDDPTQAVATLDAIVERDAPVFRSLHTAHERGVTLTLLLGNHDIELCTPAVRARLANHLGTDRSSQFKFIYDGEAYVVGDVLIEHGNRYDAWNVVDNDRLRRFRSEQSRRLAISDAAYFYPPAGSEMVERIMNPIKHEFPFIDLLKPETEAAIPLLLVLNPEFADAARTIEAMRLRRKSQEHGLQSPARPGRPGDIVGHATGNASGDTLGLLLARQLPPSSHQALSSLIETSARERREQLSNIGGRSSLSMLRLKFARSLEARLEILLHSLRSLQNDRSFDRACETGAEYLQAATTLEAQGFNVVVFGHTHLAKQQRLPRGGVYLNTGTWADLIRVPAEILNEVGPAAMDHLRTFAQAIAAQRFESYVSFAPTFAHIRMQEGVASSADIYDYEPGTLCSL